MKNILEESYVIFLRGIKKGENLFADLILTFISIFIIYFVSIPLKIFFSQSIPSINPFFVYAGIISGFVASNGIIMGNEIINDKNGFLKILLVSPISKFSILLGNLSLLLFSLIKYYTLILLAIMFIHNSLNALNLLFFIIILIFMLISSLSLGLFFASLPINTWIKNKIFGVITAFFLISPNIPLAILPKNLKFIQHINPWFYATEILRHLLSGEGEMPLVISLIVFLCFIIVIIPLGLVFFDHNIRN